MVRQGRENDDAKVKPMKMGGWLFEQGGGSKGKETVTRVTPVGQNCQKSVNYKKKGKCLLERWKEGGEGVSLKMQGGDQGGKKK